jgi:hypothetical protein
LVGGWLEDVCGKLMVIQEVREVGKTCGNGD